MKKAALLLTIGLSLATATFSKDNISEKSITSYYELKYARLAENALEKSQKQSIILVDKLNKRLYLLKGKKIVQNYPIELGFNPLCDKLMEGDGCTPEGEYFISAKKGIDQSSFYKAFLINYPNKSDYNKFRQAKSLGIIPPNAEIGGDIEIHGSGGKGYDWTLGCIAIKNSAMDSLDKYVEQNTPVIIVKKINKKF